MSKSDEVDTKASLPTAVFLSRPPAVVFVNSSKGALFLADAVNKVGVKLDTISHVLGLVELWYMYMTTFCSLFFQSCTHLSAVGIHRDTPQERRTAILRDFLEGKYSVCVNTGVWARGLDLVNVQQASRDHLAELEVACFDVLVSCFIQVFVFDMPSTVRQFIHQVQIAIMVMLYCLVCEKKKRLLLHFIIVHRQTTD